MDANAGHTDGPGAVACRPANNLTYDAGPMRRDCSAAQGVNARHVPGLRHLGLLLAGRKLTAH